MHHHILHFPHLLFHHLIWTHLIFLRQYFPKNFIYLEEYIITYVHLFSSHWKNLEKN
jgi:hypothetical protein